MPIARTKCAWNAGSIAVSILTIRRATSAASCRAAPDSSARTAPAPAALPTLRAIAGSQSGMSPSTIAYAGSMWLPNAPASRTVSKRSSSAWSISSRTPALSAALASWIARTSACVMRNSPAGPPCREPSCSTYAKVRSSATTRGERAAAAPSIVPSRRMTPARNNSAITSITPDPHTPVTPTLAACPAKPGSSDHGSMPITFSRGSSVAGSTRTRSIAPAVARWPLDSCAPSNAGPVGLDAA